MASENFKIEGNEKIHVSKIDLLIHPGFLTDPSVYEQGEKGREKTPEFAALLDKYIEHSKEFKNDEIMVAFTHTGKSELRSDVGLSKLYVNKLKELREILKDRLVVLSDDLNIFDEAEAIAMLKRILHARGYDFDENVVTEAYGETIRACVETWAEGLNATAQLKNKTQINPRLTDLDSPGRLPSDMLEEHKSNVLKSFDRIEYKNADNEMP
ncbi:MAG: hypothetical protein AAB916_03145 [Patescibacteria group bacterium]